MKRGQRSRTDRHAPGRGQDVAIRSALPATAERLNQETPRGQSSRGRIQTGSDPRFLPNEQPSGTQDFAAGSNLNPRLQGTYAPVAPRTHHSPFGCASNLEISSPESHAYSREWPRLGQSGDARLPDDVDELFDDSRDQVVEGIQSLSPFRRLDQATGEADKASEGFAGPSMLRRNSSTTITSKQGGNELATYFLRSQSLDTSRQFKIQRFQFFNPGRVFWSPWYEPDGRNQRQSISSLQKLPEETASGHSNSHVVKKNRIMVVIKQLYAHCLCLPVFTYDGQGVNKRNRKGGPVLHNFEIRQHAVIYDADNQAWSDDEEVRLGPLRPAIGVDTVPGQTLNEWSRMRYDSICLVRYNWQVCEIGQVSDVHMDRLFNDFAEALAQPMVSESKRQPDRSKDAGTNYGGRERRAHK